MIFNRLTLLPLFFFLILTSCYKSNSTDFENQKESEKTQPLQKPAPTQKAPDISTPTAPAQQPETATPTTVKPTAVPTAATPATPLPVTPPKPTPSKPVQPAIIKPEPTNTSPVKIGFEPLAWEKFKRDVPNSGLWTKMIYEIIEKKTPDILSQNSADDVEVFCPKYRTLTDQQRENFWAQLFVGIAKFESGWHATSSVVETKMNSKDSVTGLHVASEGLLQLSYQDEKNYGLKCGFNWNIDKKYKQHDERKTILDPYKNLNCGIQIFANQLRRFRRIVVPDSRQLYWAVIYNGRYSKIKEISEITKSLSFCK